MLDPDLLMKIDKGKLPRHIAIVMDGNGRWADASRLASLPTPFPNRAPPSSGPRPGPRSAGAQQERLGEVVPGARRAHLDDVGRQL